jgi:hypothetical protein
VLGLLYAGENQGIIAHLDSIGGQGRNAPSNELLEFRIYLDTTQDKKGNIVRTRNLLPVKDEKRL